MIYGICGTNQYLVQTRLQEIVSSFKAGSDEMGLERLDGEEAEFNRISEALTTLPFLVPKKLVILRNPSANKEFIDNAEHLFAEIPPATDVVILETKVDKRSSYYKLLKKLTDFHEYSELDPESLVGWLVETAEKLGGTLSLRDARLLIDRIGNNQQRLENELQKLVIYDPVITKDTVVLLTDKVPQSTIFELIDAAINGNSKRAFELYSEQRQQKVEPQQIIAMLAWQLHVLALVQAAGNKDSSTIATESKLNPYVVRKVQGLARRLSTAEVKVFLADLLELDVNLKTKTVDADEALQNYLLLSLGVSF